MFFIILYIRIIYYIYILFTYLKFCGFHTPPPPRQKSGTTKQRVSGMWSFSSLPLCATPPPHFLSFLHSSHHLLLSPPPTFLSPSLASASISVDAAPLPTALASRRFSFVATVTLLQMASVKARSGLRMHSYRHTHSYTLRTDRDSGSVHSVRHSHPTQMLLEVHSARSAHTHTPRHTLTHTHTHTHILRYSTIKPVSPPHRKQSPLYVTGMSLILAEVNKCTCVEGIFHSRGGRQRSPLWRCALRSLRSCRAGSGSATRVRGCFIPQMNVCPLQRERETCGKN